MNRISTISGVTHPAEYFNRMRKQIEPTPQMVFGTALHEYLLLGKCSYHVVDSNELNKDGSVKAATLKKFGLSEQEVISQQWLNYFEFVRAELSKLGWDKLFRNCETKMAFAFDVSQQEYCPSYNDEYYNGNLLFLTGRCDAFSHNYVLDIKTLSDVRLKQVLYTALDRGYVRQLYLYKQGLVLAGKCNPDAKLLLLAISNNIEIPMFQLYEVSDANVLRAQYELVETLSAIRKAFDEPVYTLSQDILTI